MTAPTDSSAGARSPRTAGRRARKRGRERGVALVLVLGALTILTVMLTDFQDNTSAELGSALSARDSLKAEYAARSAISLSRLLIASEPTIRKVMAPLFMMMGSAPPQIPVWEFSDQVLGAFNDKLGAMKFSALASVSLDKGKNLGLEGAGFEIEIIDEDSKINLNSPRDLVSGTRTAAQIMGLIKAPQFDPLFTARDGDGQYSDRFAICSALVDWVDMDQIQTNCDFTNTSPSTATEDSFYQLLDPPYFRKNAPFDSLEEVRLVRGIGDDFWSTFVEPDPVNQRRRPVTVWGTGKVNVNTANAQTLLAVVCANTNPPAKMCMDPLEAAKFIGIVTLVRQFTAGAPLFGSPKGFIAALKQTNPMIGPLLKMMGLEPVTFASEAEATKSITTESKVFSIIATGYVRSGQRQTKVRIHSVVDFRNAPPPPNVLAALMAAGGGSTGAAGGAAGGLAAGGLAGGLAGGGLAAGGLAGASTPNLASLQSSLSGLPPGSIPGVTPQNLPAGATSDAYSQLLVPSPGGRIVYFHFD